jgi:acid phosphatase family membrane protein YuiD
MSALATLLSNKVLVAALTWWAVAQLIKVPINYAVNRKIDFRLLTSSGGMPSSHAALVCALATGVALHEGLNSPLFAMCVAFAMIVMYDATGVRQAAGKQAAILNVILDELFQGHPISEERLKELLGHTRFQVIVGALMGILGTLVMWEVWRAWSD